MRLILLVALLVVGCDAQSASPQPSLHVMCHSGDVVTYDGRASAIVPNEPGVYGWFVIDPKTGKRTSINSECVVTD
jgi:hypothetical protein